MKVFLLILLLVIPLWANTYVAVVETISENGVVGRSERMFITDKLRERAKRILPEYMGYIIMTRENIDVMLDPTKKIEECEGSCLVETGRNIGANFISQARVGRFGEQLTLSVELYETKNNNLVGSFTALSVDTVTLLREIEQKADGLFEQILIRNSNNYGDVQVGTEGISELSMGGSGYHVEGSRKVILNVNSKPKAARVSMEPLVDGRCSKTPCDMQLHMGRYRFEFNKDMYESKDTLLNVDEYTNSLLVELKPKFGVFNVNPKLVEGIGSYEEVKVFVDGQEMTPERRRLDPGMHDVKVVHQCYETDSFMVNIEEGRKKNFDRTLKPLMGTIDLNAVDKDGTPVSLPVYINNQFMGNTPFLKNVPVCSQISIEKKRIPVPATIKKNWTVSYTHKYVQFRNGSSFIDERDGQSYVSVKIGKLEWMAENLKYRTSNSYCYNDDENYCSQYGRLYESTDVEVACPDGWRIPSESEYEALIRSAGGRNFATNRLRSSYGWLDRNGSDDYGFGALPAGILKMYRGERYYGYDSLAAYFWGVREDASFGTLYNVGWAFDPYDVVQLDFKYGDALSIRCVRDYAGMEEVRVSSPQEEKKKNFSEKSSSFSFIKRDGPLAIKISDIYFALQFRMGVMVGLAIEGSISDSLRLEHSDVWNGENNAWANSHLGNVILSFLGMIRINKGSFAFGIGGGLAGSDISTEQRTRWGDIENVTLVGYSTSVFQWELGWRFYDWTDYRDVLGDAQVLMEMGIRNTQIFHSKWRAFSIGGYVKFADVFDIEIGFYNAQSLFSGVYMGMNLSMPWQRK